MDRLVILFKELKKYFILTDENAKNRSFKWKCNACEILLYSGDRMKHLRYNHTNIFQEIDKKLPIKDVTKKRLSSSSNVKCEMCGEEFKDKTGFSRHRRLYLNILIDSYFIVLKQIMEDLLVVLEEMNFFRALFVCGRNGVNVQREKRENINSRREQRLQKMLERFKNEENSSEAELYRFF